MIETQIDPTKYDDFTELSAVPVWSSEEISAALTNNNQLPEIAHKILGELRVEGPLMHSQLARNIGVSREQVWSALSMLSGDSLVEIQEHKEGMPPVYTASDYQEFTFSEQLRKLAALLSSK